MAVDNIGAERMPGRLIQLQIDTNRLAKQLLILLVSVEVFLVALDLVVNYFEMVGYSSIQRIFNIAREDGLAAWFMVSQTFLAAMVLWLLYWLSRNSEAYRSAQRRGWLILALFFTYMSADDGALIHERIGTMLEKMIGKIGDAGVVAQWLGAFPSYEWQFLLPFFGLMGLYLIHFLWKVMGVGRPLMMVVAAFACFAAAVILDFIEGLPAGHKLNIYTIIKQAYLLEGYTVDHFAKSLEEFLEMLGMSFFLVVFVTQVGGAAVTFRSNYHLVSRS